MCLNIKSNTKLKTALKDIICYKALKDKTSPDLTDLKSGDEFTGQISNIDCSGKISIVDDVLYFCTNKKSLDGDYCSEKYGYNYSWSYDYCVGDMVINGKPLNFIKYLITPYRNFKIEIGNTYDSELSGNDYQVSKGLHSFADLDDSKKSFQVDENMVFVECIIPKGSSYYKGTFENFISYASNKLTYVKIV